MNDRFFIFVRFPEKSNVAFLARLFVAGVINAEFVSAVPTSVGVELTTMLVSIELGHQLVRPRFFRNAHKFGQRGEI